MSSDFAILHIHDRNAFRSQFAYHMSRNLLWVRILARRLVARGRPWCKAEWTTRNLSDVVHPVQPQRSVEDLQQCSRCSAGTASSVIGHSHLTSCAQVHTAITSGNAEEALSKFFCQIPTARCSDHNGFQLATPATQINARPSHHDALVLLEALQNRHRLQFTDATPRCYNCGISNHMTRECPFKNKNVRRLSLLIHRCYGSQTYDSRPKPSSSNWWTQSAARSVASQ